LVVVTAQSVKSQKEVSVNHEQTQAMNNIKISFEDNFVRPLILDSSEPAWIASQEYVFTLDAKLGF